jgi:hypothetical protein
MDSNWLSLRHLLHAYELTICLFVCMGTGEAKPSGQTYIGCFQGSLDFYVTPMNDTSQLLISIFTSSSLNSQPL